MPGSDDPYASGQAERRSRTLNSHRLSMNKYRFDSTRFDAVQPIPALYLAYEFTLVVIDTGNVSPFGIDPE